MSARCPAPALWRSFFTLVYGLPARRDTARQRPPRQLDRAGVKRRRYSYDLTRRAAQAMLS
jgi:hypothetical protein